MIICFVPLICAFAFPHQRADFFISIDFPQADTTANVNTDSLRVLSSNIILGVDSVSNDTSHIKQQLSALDIIAQVNETEWSFIEQLLIQWQNQYKGNDTLLIAKEKMEIGNATVLYKHADSLKGSLDTTADLNDKLARYKLIIEHQSMAIEKMKWLSLSLGNLSPQQQLPIVDSIITDNTTATIEDEKVATNRTTESSAAEEDSSKIELQTELSEPDTVLIANNQRFMDAIFTKDSLSLRTLISGFDKTSLTEAWNLYRQLRFDEVAKVDSTDNPNHQGGLIATQSDTTNQASNHQAANQTPQSVDQFMALFDSSEKNDTTVTDKVTFVVQISACRQPLDSAYLRAIYKGDKTIQTKLEDGWHKYQIGSCYEYSQAKEVLKSINIKGAFIVAYRNNEKLTLWRVLKDRKPAIESTSDESLTFAVQIVASREPVTKQYIQKKYKGNAPWRMVEEDNWYKYQIVTGTSYGEAKNKLSLCGVKGAFVVAYKEGERIPLKQAIKMAKQQLP